MELTRTPASMNQFVLITFPLKQMEAGRSDCSDRKVKIVFLAS